MITICNVVEGIFLKKKFIYPKGLGTAKVFTTTGY